MSKKKLSRTRLVSQSSSRLSWYDSWDRLSETRQHVVCLLFLVVVSFGFFAPIHFSGKNLIAGDTVRWMSMAKAMLSYQAETGDPALWSPNMFAGMPGFMISYGTRIVQADIVTSWLRSFIWPSSHLLLLLFGVYVLVWTLGRNKLSSVFSAVAFGLTTYLAILLATGHNSKFIALAWAPWLLVAFAYVLSKPSLRAGLLFAAAAALNLRAGHVQITYYVLFLAGVWWVGEGIRAGRAGEFGGFLKSTLWLAAGGALALVMVAQPYLAYAEYKHFTIRGAAPGGVEGGLSWAYAMAWSQGVGELLTVLVANAYGGGGSLYWGPKSFTGGPHYFGSLTVILAVLAIVRRRDALTWIFASAGFLMLIFALGENFPLLNRPMFDYFPLFSAWRVPETWMSVVALVTAILAGFGLSGLASGKSLEAESAEKKRFFAVFGAGIGLLLILLTLQDTMMDFKRPGEEAQIFRQFQMQYPDITASDTQVQRVIAQEIGSRQAGRRAVFQKDARRSLLFLAAGFIIILLVQRRRLPAWLGVVGLILLISLDLGGVGRRYVHEGVLTRSADAGEEVPKYAFDDFILDRVEEAGGPGHFRVLSLEFGQDPSTNARPSFFYESLGGYHGAKLRVYQDFLEQILFDPSTNGLNPRAVDMMNTRYLIGARAPADYTMVFQDDASGNAVFENSRALPRAFFVGRAEILDTPSDVWNRLRSDSFDPAESVILMSDTGKEGSPLDSFSVARARLVVHTPREIEWEIETDADRWLVVSEVYYPAGWVATLDGSEIPIEQANYLLRAVFLPAGEHTLRMAFNPASHTMGVLVAGISTLFVYGTLFFLFAIWLYRRKKKDSSSETLPQ